MSTSGQGVRPGYRFLRFLVRGVFRACFRGRVFGREHLIESGGVLVVANHQSFLDPPLVGAPFRRECYFMARETLWRGRFLGAVLSYVNAFPVRRGRTDVAAVKTVMRLLRDGQAVIIFPEGTRSRDGSIQRLNPNTLAIAGKAGVPILPAVVDGAFEALPRGRALPRPRRIRITFVEPVTAGQAREWPLERVVDTVMTRMREAMARSRAEAASGSLKMSDG